ncbi:MAG TPA: cyclic nucleotide-binding domain-containing protein [Sediminispirochaeta sp.]|nr:cyclic nucleotide-binding domain-containing protein [Sediminispirochaeta sp.]
MPKALKYHANSVVYFKGDTNDRIYILQSGKVSLNYNDIETGQDIHELINTGEFFGVKSALGRYPREETAVVLSDATMVIFSVPEFEQFAMQNTRIIMKMLKVFSNQLRRMHKQVRNLISSSSDGIDPEEGLFKIGQYYMNVGKYHQALYAFRRYITYYPSGNYSSEATGMIDQAEQRLQGGGGTPPSPRNTTKEAQEELSETAKKYYNAVSLYSQENYSAALKEFQEIIKAQQSDEYVAKSHFEYGRCLLGLEKYQECIQHFSQMIKHYPKHPDLRDALIYVGQCNEKLGENERAKSFYKKVIAMSSENEVVYRKAKRALRQVEDKK